MKNTRENWNVSFFFHSIHNKFFQEEVHLRNPYLLYSQPISPSYLSIVLLESAVLIDREEYLEFKETYLSEQEQAHKKLKEKQIYYQNILERLMAKIDWADELIKYQGVTEITREIVERFIEKVVVKSATEITVYFWFGDIFEQEVPDMERGLLDAV